MEPGTHEPDRRVRRTRTAIQDALVALVLEKGGYDAVTASDVIARADVGRSTFYTHFRDKDDVLESSLVQLSELLRRDGSATDRPFAFSLLLFEHVHDRRPLLRVLVRSGGLGVHGRITATLADVVADELRRVAGDVEPRVPVQVVTAAVVGAYMALFALWLEAEAPWSPREMDAAFRRLVMPGVRAAVGPAAVTS